MSRLLACSQWTKLSSSNEGWTAMDQVNIHQAKTQLSRLLERVAAGEEIVIAKSGKPLAKLVPFREVVRQPGRLKGKIKIGRDFDAPLPDALAAAFRGERV
jgi:prevent-host-death family protein